MFSGRRYIFLRRVVDICRLPTEKNDMPLLSLVLFSFFPLGSDGSFRVAWDGIPSPSPQTKSSKAQPEVPMLHNPLGPFSPRPPPPLTSCRTDILFHASGSRALVSTTRHQTELQEAFTKSASTHYKARPWVKDGFERQVPGASPAPGGSLTSQYHTGAKSPRARAPSKLPTRGTERASCHGRPGGFMRPPARSPGGAGKPTALAFKETYFLLYE